MEISFEFFIGQYLFGGVLYGTHVDDVQDPYGSCRAIRNEEWLDSLEDNSPYVDKFFLVEVFLVNVAVHKVDVNKVEELGFELANSKIQSRFFAFFLLLIMMGFYLLQH